MRCPRCESVVDDAAVRCPACSAPLQLSEEPTPVTLDRTLDLDRRRSRTPVPASTPPPAAADQDEGDLGDLSFDAPADDGPWTMAAPEAQAGEPEPGPAPMPDAPDVALLPTFEAGSPRGEWAEPDPGVAFSDDELDADAGEESPDSPDVALQLGEVAAERGKLLSLASLAIAGAAALVAVLSSR